MIGQIITALAGLVYGKLTAVYISPAVWGDYSLGIVALTLVHGLFIAPAIQSFKAALGQFSPAQAITFYSQRIATTYLMLAVPVLLAGLYAQKAIVGLVWIAAVGQGFYQLGSSYLNATNQHRLYAFIQAGYAIGTLLVFICLVFAIDQPTTIGLWQTLALVNVIGAIASISQPGFASETAVCLIPLRHSTELSQAYRQYVWPLFSLALWNWIINYADRYLIRFFLTDADVGYYSMGYSLGSKLLLVVAPLLAFLSPQILQLRSSGQPSEMANVLIYRYLLHYVLIAGVGCIGYYLSYDWIGQLFLSDRYEPAFLIGPIVAAGYLFLTSVHLLELKWYAFGQTWFILWHNVVGAVLNVGLSFLLIPRMGIVGAALATLLGFAGQFLMAIGLFTSARLNNQ